MIEMITSSPFHISFLILPFIQEKDIPNLCLYDKLHKRSKNFALKKVHLKKVTNYWKSNDKNFPKKVISGKVFPIKVI